MRYIQKELLNFRPDMIFMKRGSGLIQELIEDRGQRIGHSNILYAFPPLPNVNVKKIRLQIERWLVQFGVWWVPQLSREQVLRVARVAGWLAYLIDYRGRSTAHQNLRAAFADDHITPDQVRRVAMASYQNFARTFLDLFWSARLTPEEYSRLVTLHWQDPTTPELARKGGSLWVSPHFGNFELMNLAVGVACFPLVTIAQNFKNETLTGVFAKLRQGTGNLIIPQQGAMLRIVKELKRGGHASLLTDLNVKPGRSAGVIECFGLKTCVTTLHTSLAQRLSLPVIPSICLPQVDGTYRCWFAAPMFSQDYSSPREMAQAVWDRFMPSLREMPEGWLWMYKHWRYLPGTPDDTRYPGYANPSPGFEAMVQNGAAM